MNPSARSGRIQAVGLTKIFAREDMNATLQALDNVNLAIEPGEFVSIVGTSGCGKSTLLRIVAGLEIPTRGEVLCDGKRVNGPDPQRGLVFQEHNLYPWLTVRGNIEFALKSAKKFKGSQAFVKKLLEVAGLTEFANSYPHQLSGGMRQRASLIRALAVAPDVLLLDEPLGALDSFTRMNLQDEIISLWKERGSTMILITHDVDEAIYLSQRILIMSPRPGRITSELQVPISYPRNRSSSDFVQLRNVILQRLNFARESSEEFNL
ncbi:MAG: ABC transporter ATP-binding protein [Oscillospiraceae bacterium]|nr:ABC transporter ATP-binding protein [Oscillospiraceae bacterium]